jgi:hypothetical protein
MHMTTRNSLCTMTIGLLLGVALPAGVTLAQQPPATAPLPAQPAQAVPVQPAPPAAAAAPAAAQVDTHGNVVAPGAAAPLAALAPPPTHACLQLHLGGTVFNFNLQINPNAYPYPVTGGTITGSICGAPWAVTGGSLGSALHINGHKSPPAAGCATTISVVGNFNPPGSWIGTYGFNGSSTMFNHHTLFLGYNRPTCP